MLTDTHAHLDHERFDSDRDDVITRAADAGIGLIVNPGTTIETSEKAVQLSERYDAVYAAVGIHPSDADSFNETSIDRLRELSRSAKVVAIGEIGLDFYWDGVPHSEQEQVFREQIRLAHELSLPVIVHSRNAEARTLEILREERAQKIRGVLHCFGGTLEQAQTARKLGFLIGINGPVTFKNSDRADLASRFVIDSILIETDSPYLAPHPHRGDRNEPAHVKLVAEKLAETGPFSLDDIHRITSHNARRLFGIGDVDATRIAYNIRDSLYLNITNECTLTCAFCPKTHGDFTVKGHSLQLDREPSVDEILEAVGDPAQWREVVFCGYGESTLRLETMKEVAGRLRRMGMNRIRLDTDGLANFVYERDITPELAGLIDAVSVSLNAPDAETYKRVCRPGKEGDAWLGVQDFIRRVKQHVPEVTASMVAMPRVDVEKTRHIAEDELGVDFRARDYNVMGEGYDSKKK
jgi:TatD DNase family protein